MEDEPIGISQKDEDDWIGSANWGDTRIGERNG
jgi:hypothetical protein